MSFLRTAMGMFVGVVLTASLLAVTGCRDRARPAAQTSQATPAASAVTVESTKVTDPATTPIKEVVDKIMYLLWSPPYDPPLTPKVLVDRAEEAVPELIRYLTLRSSLSAQAAGMLVAIGVLRGPALVAPAKPELLAMMDDKEPELRSAAIAALGLFPGSLSPEQVDRFAHESFYSADGVTNYLELSAQEQDLDRLERWGLSGGTTGIVNGEKRTLIGPTDAAGALISVGLRTKPRVMRIFDHCSPEEQGMIASMMIPEERQHSMGGARERILPEKPGKEWLPTVAEIARSGRYATEVRVDAARQLREVDPERASAVYQEWVTSGNPELQQEARNRLAELKGTYGGHVSAPGGAF